MPFFRMMSDNMKKTIMLKKNYEFRKIFSIGKHYYGKHIEVYISNNKEKINKIGIAISKRVANSVQRHKIRRLIKENYRIIESDVKSGINILFMWKKDVDIKEANFYIIQNDIISIFDKSGVIEKNERNNY